MRNINTKEKDQKQNRNNNLVDTKAHKGKILLTMQQSLHADKVIPSIPENKFDKYRSQQTALKQCNPAAQTSKSLQAKSDQSGYHRSLLITKINSCSPNTFRTSWPFQCHRTTSLAVQAVTYISKIVLHCS
jgi:hypothetical protein